MKAPGFGRSDGLSAFSEGDGTVATGTEALRRKTARGGAIGGVAELIRLSIHFAVLAVLARLLEPKDFGLFAMAAVLTGLAGMFTDFGLSTATIQHRKLTRSLVSGLFYLNLGIGMAACGLAVLLAPIAARLFGEPTVATLILVLAITLPLVAAGRQHAALLRREMRWGLSEGIRIAAQFAGAIAAILAALVLDLGVWSLAIQAIVAALIEVLALWWAMPWRPGRVSNWGEVRTTSKFGINLTLFSLLNFLHRQSDDVMIGWRWGATDLGYYNRAYALLSIPLQLFRGPLTAVVVPTLSRLQDDDRAWADLYRNTLTAALILTVPVCFAMIILADRIVGILFGPGWGEATVLFRILSVSLIAQLIMSSTGWLWVSKNQTRQMLTWAKLSVPVMIAAMLVGLPFGARGVAIGYVTAFCLLTPLCSWMAARTLPITFAEIFHAAVRPVAAGLVSYGLSRLGGEGWTGAAIFVLIYCITIVLVDRKSLAGMVSIARTAIRK